LSNNLFKKIYELYTKDLTTTEFERLVTKDIPGLYKFYSKDMKKPDESRDSVNRGLLFVRNFIVALLRKLTPIRRILFSVAILIFLFCYFTDSYGLYEYSFIILVFLVILEVADKIIAKDEISIAREVQNSMIPQTAPKYNGYDIDCCCETANDVGGDFIDFMERDGKLLTIIGDISGKGMGAALHMVHVRAIIRYVADLISEPGEILKTLNKDILKNFKRGLFLTIVLAEIDSNGIKICRGGHPPVIHFKHSENRCIDVKPAGSALGMLKDELFTKTLGTENIPFEKNDIYLIYTDGLFEAMNSKKQEYGMEKVKEILTANHYKTSTEIKNILINSVNRFRGYTDVNDDITFAVIKCI